MDIIQSSFKSRMAVSSQLFNDNIFIKKAILICGNGGSAAEAMYMSGE